MADAFSRQKKQLDSPYDTGFSVTTSNSTPLAVTPRAIYVGGAGDVVFTDSANNTLTLKAVPVGTMLRIRPQYILTSSTATLMVALY